MRRKIMSISATLINGTSGTITRGMLIALSVLFFVTLSFSYAVSDESAKVPEGAAPSIEAKEIEKAEPVFRKANDGSVPQPNHPPIDQIPPIPMPEPSETDDPPKSIEPGSGVYHDMETGETIEEPADEGVRLEGLEPKQGGGHNGADGGGQDSETWRTGFNNMSKITNTSDHPWRMNAKVVIRFEDSGGNSAYYVGSGTMRGAKAVLTAGHCVYSQNYGWAKEIWAYPGRNSSATPYGYGTSTYLGSWTGWTVNGDINYDVGIIGIDRSIGSTTGWYGWAWGGSCSSCLSKTYNNASYPSAESCFNGLDMYYWYGSFDSCYSSNMLQLDTGGGCLDSVWGGMSGSGAYYKDGVNRYVHAVCSSSAVNKTYAVYCKQWESWINYINDTFIPKLRGDTFDLQALDVNAEPATIKAGNSTTLLNHLATNPTNGSTKGTWTYRVYLSTNDNISSADTLLSTQDYSWDFSAMSSVWVNMIQVTIPSDTPPGDYWIGIIYDSATDGDRTNNETDGCDAIAIHVN